MDPQTSLHSETLVGDNESQLCVSVYLRVGYRTECGTVQCGICVCIMCKCVNLYFQSLSMYLMCPPCVVLEEVNTKRAIKKAVLSVC